MGEQLSCCEPRFPTTHLLLLIGGGGRESNPTYPSLAQDGGPCAPTYCPVYVDYGTAWRPPASGHSPSTSARSLYHKSTQSAHFRPQPHPHTAHLPAPPHSILLNTHDRIWAQNRGKFLASVSEVSPPSIYLTRPTTCLTCKRSQMRPVALAIGCGCG